MEKYANNVIDFQGIDISVCKRGRSKDRSRECKIKSKINQRRLGDFYFVLRIHIVNN